MTKAADGFDVHHTIEHLRHFLPSQAALKDFVHHNTLHAFQDLAFHDALWQASAIFGYRTYLSIDEFRDLHRSGQIRPEVLEQAILRHDGAAEPRLDGDPAKLDLWKHKLLDKQYDVNVSSRLFQLSRLWKELYEIDLSKVVHPLLFRLLASYLDQGIAQWKFPVIESSFLASLRALELNGYVSLFKTGRARKLLLEDKAGLADLLLIVVGNEAYFEQYLFDQQFAHPGWAGFVSVVEQQPETLLDRRKISLEDLIYFELLLEIDTLDEKFGPIWKPLMTQNESILIQPLFEKVEVSELKTVLQMWQEAYEWSYFDSVLAGIQQSRDDKIKVHQPAFQGLFCIDDREYSFRRHIEAVEPRADTFGTPGYFGVEFYFQPENGKFVTRACPANINPKFLVKEVNRKKKIQTDAHFRTGSHSLVWGGLISGTLGFWSALKLFFNLFKPSLGSLTVHSFEHADKHAALEIDSSGGLQDGLKIGFTNVEMASRVGKVLRSIGLTDGFAPIVYVVGHGGSSVNNPYYAGYDCGACAGRPGAVNARAFAYMANKKEVRTLLRQGGLSIPDGTHFMGAMHDTTRDEIEFYDEDALPLALAQGHELNVKTYHKALELNALERSYRFETLNSKRSLAKVHQKVKDRSVSLFEPRPEWNHTDNALCIVGRKRLYKRLYLDKRPFINSYDCTQDDTGALLDMILSAAIPVCGGINLEYYFSRVDQQKLGAGTKLPHNVVGLFGLNTGVDGDLRTGLPSQMVEIHAPVRILFIIEHHPEVVHKVISTNANLNEWVVNEWVLLVAVHPESGEIFRFTANGFQPFKPIANTPCRELTAQSLMDVIVNKEPAFITR